MRSSALRRLSLSGLFLALALSLPFLTGSIPQLGQTLLPMHLPVLLCGFLVGWKEGGIVGLVAPLLRSILFGMPPFFPTAAAMAFELAAYGIAAGILIRLFPKKWPFFFLNLMFAMIIGRIIWGLVSWMFSVWIGNAFPFSVFLSGAVLNALPGILIQFVLIPPLLALWYPKTDPEVRG
jgi:thiamine transporter ThiT